MTDLPDPISGKRIILKFILMSVCTISIILLALVLANPLLLGAKSTGFDGLNQGFMAAFIGLIVGILLSTVLVFKLTLKQIQKAILVFSIILFFDILFFVIGNLNSWWR